MLGGSGGSRWFWAWQSLVCGKLDKKKREDRFLGLCPGTGLFGIDGRHDGSQLENVEQEEICMRLERVTDSSHPMYNEALRLYRMSFPYHEQREELSQKRILGNSEYCFDLVYDEDRFVGLILYWENEEFIYIEHFCICPEMRNKRYGERVLALLGKGEKPRILEIDPPVDDISRRRKGFYERCGFIDNPYEHTHPAYHPESRGHSLVLMTSPERLSREAFERFSRYLGERVMKDAFAG